MTAGSIRPTIRPVSLTALRAAAVDGRRLTSATPARLVPVRCFPCVFHT